MLRTYTLKQVDAFTRTAWAGNPAGVVLDATGLADSEMQSIAREMNLPETAFILPPTGTGADLRIRWFTPTNEVDLCGHATIASFHALAEAGTHGMSREGHFRFTVETRSGNLGVDVENTDRGMGVQFELPVPSFREVADVPVDLREALGLNSSDIESGLPMAADAYAYVPVRSRHRLHELQPTFADLDRACVRLGVGGVCVFTLDVIDKQSAVHSRFFAPSLGVDEDPVTGSANGPLGCYLATYVRAAGLSVVSRTLSDGRREFVGEQGDALGRPGRVRIRLSVDGGRIQGVWIVGHAVTVMEATLRLTEKE